ncbi:MAG: hypothetical protein H3C63_16395, partial [Candidatus Omnitrophica bacterium]|nr:hypothetical protein [Candidatus Omnitrophota bacterium]
MKAEALMAQNPEKWHLYMDESGEFEGESLTKKSLIFGLIVSENEKEEAKSLYQAICFNHGVNPSNHATENKGNKNYRQFLERLCKEFCEYFPGQFFYIEHGEDQHAEKGTSIPENINANRYLLMANEILEYLI